MKSFSILLLILIFLGLNLTAQEDFRFVKAPSNTRELEKLKHEVSLKWKRDSTQAVKQGLPLFIDKEGEPTKTFKGFQNGLPNYVANQTLAEVNSYYGSQLWAAPFNATGSGFPIGIWEAFSGSNALPDAANINLLTNGVAPSRIFAQNAGTVSGHATQVALRAISDAAGAASEQGIAKSAQLLAYDITAEQSEMVDYAVAGYFVSNHSYAYPNGWNGTEIFGPKTYSYWEGVTNISNTIDYKFGRYYEDDAFYDELSYLAPYYLIVKAAANEKGAGPSQVNYSAWTFSPGPATWARSYFDNAGSFPEIDGGVDGFDCLPIGATAKNMLVVGACANIVGGYSLASDVALMYFSSTGPTDDGRIKPDIVAPGQGGTSYAAPNVTGTVSLLQNVFYNKYSDIMKAATVRGLLIHTAYEAGANPGPDYKMGYGMMNPVGAATLIQNTNGLHKIEESTLANATSKTYYYYSDSTNNLSATLCWTDPQGVPTSLTLTASDLNNSTTMLVNNLNVSLTHISSVTTTYPYILNPANPASAATKGVNSRDNAEKIEEASPLAGWYKIDISHTGTLKDNLGSTANQDFSLITSGFLYSSCGENTVTIDNIYASGSWSAGAPVNGQGLLVLEDVTIASNLSCKNLFLGADVDLTIASSIVLTVTASVESMDKARIIGEGKVLLSGPSAQLICGEVEINNLELNNSSNASIKAENSALGIKTTIELTNGVLTTNSNLTLLSTADVNKKEYAQLHHGSGNLAGSLTYQQTIQGTSGWRYIASPVNTTLEDLLEDQLLLNISGTGSSALRWDASTSQYVNPTAISDAFNATSPYNVFFGTTSPTNYIFNEMPFTAKLSGTVNTGAVDNTLFYHDGTGGDFLSSAIDGWNLIANPYPENLDWSSINVHADFGSGNLNGSYYVWDASQNKYLTHNGSAGDAELGGKIAPMQSFFVKLNNSGAASSTAFDFTNANRTLTKAQFLKTNFDYITLALHSNGNFLDKTYITFQENATSNFDSQFDAYQIKGKEKTPLIYTAAFNGKDTSIVAINAQKAASYNYKIPIFIDAPNTENFTISIDSMQLNPAWSIELISTADSTIHDLRNSALSFNYNAKDGGQHFWFHINKKESATQTTNAIAPEIWMDGVNLQIQAAFELKNAEVKIINSAGQIVFTQTGLNGFELKIPRNIWANANGIYIVELRNAGETYRQKIVFAE